MSEIGLAIGAERRKYAGTEREWLYWYDENDVRYPTPIERAAAESTARLAAVESQRANIEATARIAAQQENDALRQRLRELGIDPDSRQ